LCRIVALLDPRFYPSTTWAHRGDNPQPGARLGESSSRGGGAEGASHNRTVNERQERRMKSSSPSQLERDLRRTFSSESSRGLVVAVSGGADSVALFDALLRAREAGWGAQTLVVAHFNHRLRGAESDLDAAFVGEMAARHGVPSEMASADVATIARQSRLNLEATARTLRYRFLAEVAGRHRLGCVVTGHTLDDQAETVLLRLLRGSGMRGLSGMSRQRPLLEDGDHSLTLWRPLLEVSRESVLAHCRRYQLPYREDLSNQSRDYLRNVVRQEILPRLAEINPSLREGLGRLADLLREEDQYLEAYVASIPDWKAADGSLRLPVVRNQPSPIRRRILRTWLMACRGHLNRITSTHLAALDRLVEGAQSGRAVVLPGRLYIRREFDRLRMLPLPARDPGDKPLRSDPSPSRLLQGVPIRVGSFELTLLPRLKGQSSPPPPPDRRQWHLPLPERLQTDPLFVRTRQPGDRYRPGHSRHTFKLKTLLIRHQIPASERDTYPVVVTADGAIVWVPGLPVAQDWFYVPSSDAALPCAVLQVCELPNLASETGGIRVQYSAGLKRR
jgi:tRNA(Ile)-lysidine synthase